MDYNKKAGKPVFNFDRKKIKKNRRRKELSKFKSLK